MASSARRRDCADMSNTKKLLSHPVFSVLLALLVCALWGSLFPFVKIGYQAFHIESSDIPTVIVFAGLRFTACGILMVALFSTKEKKLLLPTRQSLMPVLMIALSSIILHYAFTYWALAIGESSKSAIIKQVGFLFLSCFSFLFVKEDRFSWQKPVCGVLGFGGIIVTNLNGGGFSFGVADVLLILASCCSVASTVVTKRSVRYASPLTLVAYSQLIGGVALCAAGLMMGGRLSHFDVRSLLAFAYICAASIVAYSLWNMLIKYNSISKLSVIKFSEPLFAVLLSGLILKENVWRFNYLVALVIILAAILLNNFQIKGKEV